MDTVRLIERQLSPRAKIVILMSLSITLWAVIVCAALEVLLL